MKPAADAEEASAQAAHEIGPDGEAWKHQDHGEKLRRDQEMNRLERHGFKRVDFFIHLHGADLGGEGRPGAADDHDGGHQRAQFASDGDGDGGSDILQGAQLANW